MKEGLPVFRGVEIGLNSSYIAFKGFLSGAGDPAEGLRVVVPELFYDLDVAGFFQLVDLHTEVTCRSICSFFQQGKFRFLLAHQ